MLDAIEVVGVVCAYVGFLFLIARFSDRRRASGSGWANSPVVYALALGVYCTTWTFYGSVGKATVDGVASNAKDPSSVSGSVPLP